MGETKVLSGEVCLGSNGEEDELIAVLDSASHKVEIVADWASDNVGAHRRVSVRYWTADRTMAADEINKAAIREIIGASSVNYGANYSEITGYLWTDEKFSVGGHDLIAEIGSYLGKFIRLEVEVHG